MAITVGHSSNQPEDESIALAAMDCRFCMALRRKAGIGVLLVVFLLAVFNTLLKLSSNLDISGPPASSLSVAFLGGVLQCTKHASMGCRNFNSICGADCRNRRARSGEECRYLCRSREDCVGFSTNKERNHNGLLHCHLYSARCEPQSDANYDSFTDCRSVIPVLSSSGYLQGGCTPSHQKSELKPAGSLAPKSFTVAILNMSLTEVEAEGEGVAKAAARRRYPRAGARHRTATQAATCTSR